MRICAILCITIVFLAACSTEPANTPPHQLALFQTSGQQKELPKERISPLKQAAGLIDNAVVKVAYSSPAMRGRIIWGALVPYNEVWRTGANEATRITFEKDVLVEGQLLKAGTYSLYSIPSEHEWTIIFNEIWDQWGTEYDPAFDVLRVKVRPQPLPSPQENLQIEVEPTGISISWEKIKVSVNIRGITESESSSDAG